jgi:hypothetical protein
MRCARAVESRYALAGLLDEFVLHTQLQWAQAVFIPTAGESGKAVRTVAGRGR